MISSRPVVETRTIHTARVQWYWAEGYVDDSAYKAEVEAAMRTAVEQACRHYEVDDDPGISCQFEGVQIQGSDLQQVQAAGELLAEALGQFKHVVFIG